MTRFNGANGCTFCYADGARIGERRPVRYKYNDGHAVDRTDAEIRQDARLAHQTNQLHRVVKTVSAMIMVPGFDLRVRQLVEAMHCLWGGNFKKLYNILVNPNTANGIRPRHFTTISRILSIKTPTKLARQPRDLSYIANFTATEYRNVVLFYWLPCAERLCK